MFSYAFPFFFFFSFFSLFCSCYSFAEDFFSVSHHATDTSGFGSMFYKEMERMHLVVPDPFVSLFGTYWPNSGFDVQDDYCYVLGIATY